MQLKDMVIGIVGNGTVGKALGYNYASRVSEVRVYDEVSTLCTHTIHQTLLSDLIFVCLPTPARPDGSANTNIINNFFAGRFQTKDQNFVLKSTVPVGFTKYMADKYKLTSLVHCPEFLTARTAYFDVANPLRNIIGTPTGHSNPCSVLLTHFFWECAPWCPTVLCDSNTSELVKLATNGFYATKVGYFNELNKVASKLGINWEALLAMILLDGKIGESHTQVPGHDGKYGFGGKCLPKDLLNLIDCATQAGIEPEICKAVIKANQSNRERACHDREGT